VIRFTTKNFIEGNSLLSYSVFIVIESDPTIEDSYRVQHSFKGANLMFDILDTAAQEGE
jgi:hypothetical protein